MGCCQSKQSGTPSQFQQPCRKVNLQQRPTTSQPNPRPLQRQTATNKTYEAHKSQGYASRPDKPNTSRQAGQAPKTTTRRQPDETDKKMNNQDTVRRSRSITHQSYVEVRSPGGTTTRQKVQEELPAYDAKLRRDAMQARRYRPQARENAQRFRDPRLERKAELKAIGAGDEKVTSDRVIEAAFRMKALGEAKNAKILAERDAIRKRQEKELKKNFSDEVVRNSSKGKGKKPRSL